MRIIAGKFKGSTLFIPKNKTTRPLKDIARESIFNLLLHSKKTSFKFENSNILDLYAGSGSFGLECLSREANSVCFVEKEKDSLKYLEKNINKLNLKTKSKLFLDDVFKLVENQNFYESKFDLIFCDPPFKFEKIEKLIQLILKKKLLKKDGIIILHRKKNTKDNFPNCFEVIDERIYGISKIFFGKFLA